MTQIASSQKSLIQNSREKNYLIVGLGKSGISSAKYLVQQKKKFDPQINISTYDKYLDINKQKELLKGLSIKNFYTGDIKHEMCPKDTCIVLSPGISFSEIKAIAQGKDVVNDIFLFLKFIEKNNHRVKNLKIIGVTGTNGKTTTCFFLEHLYKSLGVNVRVAGNIGLSPLELIDDLDCIEIIILEISSFQLLPFISKGLPVKLDVGILLNLSPDHLDIHKNMEEYYQTKAELLRSSKRTIVSHNLGLNTSTEFTDISFGEGFEEVSKINNNGKSLIKYRQYFQYNKKYIFDDQGFRVEINKLKITGGHNLLNITAGIAAFRVLGGSSNRLKNILAEFKGIPHRIEWVRLLNDVDYFNDSKGTNVASTVAALENFRDKKNIILIAGGESKGQSLLPLRDHIKRNVTHLLLIGKDAKLFEECFKDIITTQIVRYESMDDAVCHAYRFARKHGVILLSPACSSIDMYKNYTERGNHFKEIVQRL